MSDNYLSYLRNSILTIGVGFRYYYQHILCGSVFRGYLSHRNTLLLLSILSVIVSMQVVSIYRDKVAAILLDDLHKARQVAVSEGEYVVLCPHVNNKCKKDWGNGWMIFIDRNKNKIRDSGESLVKSLNLSWMPIDIAGKNLDQNALSFAQNGMTDFKGLINVCDSVICRDVKTLTTNVIGRPIYAGRN